MVKKIENKIVVLCRAKEDVGIACKNLKEQGSFAEFICFSVASYVEARNMGLKATPLKQYCYLGSQTFANQSVDLAQDWLTAVLGDYPFSKEDIINSLIYPLHIFFRTVLFAKNVIPEIIKHTNPSKVILCAKCPLPNIRRENQENIFAYACQDYLNQNNIDNTIIYTKQVNETLGIKKKTLFILKKCRVFKSLLINTVFLNNLLCFLKPHKFIFAYLLLIKLTVLKYLNNKPQVIMCGAGTDAVFQGELENFWNRIRNWEIVRFESARKSKFRKTVRNASQIKPGTDMNLLLLLGLGIKTAKKNISRSEMINRHYKWGNTNKELSTLLTNRELYFQLEAMVDFVRQEINLINLYCSAFKKIKPSLIIAHNMSNPIIAARQSETKSCSQLEGIGFGVYPMDPQIGDIIAVPGASNIKMVKLYNFWSNRICNVGAFFVNRNIEPSNNDITTVNHGDGKLNSRPKVVFLVPHLSLIFQWLIEDIEGLINTIKNLILEARSGSFELVLKFHPRHGQYLVYKDIIGSCENDSNVKVSNDPNYQSLMEKTDLVIFAENSGAVIETMFAKKPLLWLSYLNPPKDDNTISFEFYSENIHQVDSCSKLLENIAQIITNKNMLKKILERQENALPKVISSTGIDAAEKLAQACETLLQFKK